MLTLLIPGPKQPGNDIDIYLAPLIDDLKDIWNNRVKVYDAFSKETFNLKAVLMWTVNDFPAYGNLSGWSTKGRFACPICRKDTCADLLTHSHQFSYMGHRRFLAPNHPYRKKMSWFNGHHEDRSRPKISTGEEISLEVDGIMIDWGKKNKNGRKNKQRKDKKGKKDQKGKRETKEKNENMKRKRNQMKDTNFSDRVWKKRSIFFELPYWKVCYKL